VTLLLAVVVPLLLGAANEAWFGYRGQRTALDKLLEVESRSAADNIQSFINGIRDQIGWVVQLPWTDGDEESHLVDALRLLRQVPAISSVTLVDDADRERVFVSRHEVNRIDRRTDLASFPGVKIARANKVWFGQVRYEHGSEPHMSIALAGNRSAAGIAIADINLKLIQDVIGAIRIGKTGHAFVVDEDGRLIAHPDISQVLRGEAVLERVKSLRRTVIAANGSTVISSDIDGKAVVASSDRTDGVDWIVIAQQPIAEAFAPIRAALWRSLVLVVGAALFAVLLAWWLARRMSGPIRQLEDGAQRIGAGQFDHRIEMSTGDELEQLANRFNGMAAELAISMEKSERINRLKRFLAPQVAELVEGSAYQGLLDGQRREVIAIFGDLRGFTAFSAQAEPETIMGLLAEYYSALGAVITRHQATLTGFAGDGLMVLVNAPVACEQPALRGARLAIDMQAAVQELIVGWRKAGHNVGFGVGAAMGYATVGTVGYEGRMDYTAIGGVVNLASRLCGSAIDTQILLDPVLVDAVRDTIEVKDLGEVLIKGYDKPMSVFEVS
jgi:class 3 adenylate cyclase